MALRRAEGARLPAQCRSRAGCAACGGTRPGKEKAWRGRPMALAAHLSGSDSLRHGRGRRKAQPLEHPTRDEGAEMVREGSSMTGPCTIVSHRLGSMVMLSRRIHRDYVEQYASVVHRQSSREELTFDIHFAQVVTVPFVWAES